MAFDSGLSHYDEPPPGELGDIEELRAADRFRFANVLRAWIEVSDDGEITGAGYGGGGLMGSTMLKLGGLRYRFQAVKLDDIQREAERSPGWVKFTQTVGGRTGGADAPAGEAPALRAVAAPPVWTTLTLTVHADGTAEPGDYRGQRVPAALGVRADGPAEPQVRPDRLRRLVRQVVRQAQPVGRRGLPGAGDRGRDGAGTDPVGAADARCGQAHAIGPLSAGDVVVRQGKPGTSVFLVLDGVIRVERDGDQLAEYGPGAILGERARSRGGVRTSTLVAVTDCRVASVEASQFDHDALVELSGGHRREDAGQG